MCHHHGQGMVLTDELAEGVVLVFSDYTTRLVGGEDGGT